MIAESHRGFHTFADRRFVTSNLYTCQTGLNTGLNRQATIGRLLGAFRLTDVDAQAQDRSPRHPAENPVPARSAAAAL